MVSDSLVQITKDGWNWVSLNTTTSLVHFPTVSAHSYYFFPQEFIIMEAIDSSLKSENDEFESSPLIDKTSDVEAIHNSEKKNSTK